MRCNLFSLVGPISLFVFSLTSVGCSTIHYQITLKPDGDAIERTLVCWQQSNASGSAIQEFPKDRLLEIADAYGAELPTKLKQKHTFSGYFVGSMPKDLDNSGTFTKWRSPFGTASMYLERFGGSDDITAQIKSWDRAANLAVDFLLHWLDSELVNEPTWQELRKVIDTRIRHDFVNLANIVLVEGGTLNPFDPRATNENSEWLLNEPGSVALRLFQYLVEHGYLEVSDITLVARLSSGKEGDIDDLLHRLVERFLRKHLLLKGNEEIPRSLAFLLSFRTMSTSFERFLKSKPSYQALVEKRKETSNEPGGNEVDPPLEEAVGAVIVEDDPLLKEMFRAFNFLGDQQRIEVKLLCPVRPVMTNGFWNEEAKQIDWKTGRQGLFGMPPLAKAIWSEPNAEEQTKRFGKVILRDEELVAYSIWYSGLKQNEAKEWGSFINTLEPGSDLARSIQAFRFSTDQPVKIIEGKTEIPPSLADVPRGILVEALKKQRDADN